MRYVHYMLINFNIHHLTKECYLTDSATMHFYPCVPTRVPASLRRRSEGSPSRIQRPCNRICRAGRQRIPIDALPVAVRRVLHHEASGGRERVDMLSLQANDDSAGAYDARSLCRHCTNVLAFVPLLATLARLWVKTTHSREHVNVILC